VHGRPHDRTRHAGRHQGRVAAGSRRRGSRPRPLATDQDVYLKALLAAGSVDHIEYGTYVARVKTAPLAVKGPQGRPGLVSPNGR
jgi:hypothetical protein